MNLLAILAAGTAVAVPPQSGAQAIAPVSTRFGDWVVFCANRKDLPPCEAAQAAKRKDTGEQVMRFSIAYSGADDRYGVQFQVPLGIRVQGDVLIRLDDKTDVSNFQITRCEIDGCFIDRIVRLADLKPFYSSSKGIIAVQDREWRPIVMPISFTGYSQAMQYMIEKNTAWHQAEKNVF